MVLLGQLVSGPYSFSLGPAWALRGPSLAFPGSPWAFGPGLSPGPPGLSLVLFVPPHWFLGSRAPTGIGPFSPLGSPCGLSGPILGISGPSLFPPWPSRAFVPGPRGCKNQHSSPGPFVGPPCASHGSSGPWVSLGLSWAFLPVRVPLGPPWANTTTPLSQMQAPPSKYQHSPCKHKFSGPFAVAFQLHHDIIIRQCKCWFSFSR